MKSLSQWVLFFVAAALLAFTGMALKLKEDFGWDWVQCVKYALAAAGMATLAFAVKMRTPSQSHDSNDTASLGQWLVFGAVLAFYAFFALALPIKERYGWDWGMCVEYAIGCAGMGTIAFAVIMQKRPSED